MLLKRPCRIQRSSPKKRTDLRGERNRTHSTLRKCTSKQFVPKVQRQLVCEVPISTKQMHQKTKVSLDPPGHCLARARDCKISMVQSNAGDRQMKISGLTPDPDPVLSPVSTSVPSSSAHFAHVLLEDLQ